MLKHLLPAPRRTPKGTPPKIQSPFQTDQAERMGLSRHLKRDPGINNGGGGTFRRDTLPGPITFL